MCLALLAGGCAGRPQGVLAPLAGVAPATGATAVEMLVATTRSAEGVPSAEMYGGDRGHALGFADIAVSIPPDSVRQIGEVQWPSKLPPDPAKEFATLRADRIGQAEALSRFASRLKRTPHRHVLVFVHGYNTRFEDSVYRFAQIIKDSKAPALPVLFTWPSRGSVLAYPYDRESANYSRDGLEAVLQFLIRDPSVSGVTVLAHSMGNWVALEALRQMAIRDRGISSKIKDVMLASPDVDVDVFRRQIAAIGDRRPPITLMVSRDDKALAISKTVWGSTERLGAVDPNAEPYKSLFAKDRITVIDLTAEKTEDRLGHTKFAESPVVVQAIGGQIARQGLNDGHPTLGESIGLAATHIAGTAGRAASVVVSAPIAIVDPKTRDGLADQVDDFGRRLTAPLRR